MEGVTVRVGADQALHSQVDRALRQILYATDSSRKFGALMRYPVEGLIS